jgi:WD40 repeat protein
VTTARERATLTGHTDRVWWVAFSPDGTLLATASNDRTARLWDVTTARERATLTEGATWAEFSPDGTLLATVSSRTVRLWAII